MNNSPLANPELRAKVLAVFIATFMVFVSLFAAPTATASSQGASASATIRISDLSPEILVDEDELVLTVHVEAASPEQLQGARITTFVHADPFGSMAEVDDFLSKGRNDSWSANELTMEQADIERATSGGTDIRIRIPVDDLPLWNAAAWGPYGVTVRLLTSTSILGSSSAQDRTLLLWYPPGETGEMQANVTVTGVADTLGPDAWSRLANVGTTVTLTHEDLRVLLANDLGQGLEIASIPSGDASLSLLAVTEQAELYRLAASTRTLHEPGVDLQESDPQDPQSGQTQSGQQVGTNTGFSAGSAQSPEAALRRSDISLIDDLVIADDAWWGLQVLRAGAGETVLTDTEGVAENSADSATPSARFLVDARTGATIVDSDQGTADSQETVTVLDSWGAAAEALSSRARSEYGDLSARQRVRALTAISAAQDVGDLSVWINVAAPELGKNPSERIAELLENPWVNPLSLQDMLESPLSTIARQPIGESTSPSAAEVAGILDPLNQELVATEDVLLAAVDGKRPTPVQLLPVLAATASDLTTQQRQVRVDSALDILSSFTRTIDVIPSGPVNVVGRNAPFPITIRNSGPYALQILVGLEAGDPRLSAKDWVPTVVPSGGSVTVQVPVQAVGTGQVEVTAVAMTEGGTTLDASEPIAVRVRADWEGPGLWIVAGLLSAALVAGVIRTIRKGKRRMSPHTTASSKKDNG